MFASTGELMARVCGEEVRGELLKRFAQTVLFRAHVSTRPEFARVDVGPHLPRLREVIARKTDSEDFGVFVVTVGGVLASPVIGFERVRIAGGVWCWKFHAGGVAYYIKVDKRPFTGLFRKLQLGGGGPVVALHHADLNPKYHASIGGMLEKHDRQIDRILGLARLDG